MSERSEREETKTPDIAPDGPSIIFFDSMNDKSHDTDQNVDIIRLYVELEYIDKKCSPEEQRFFTPQFGWQAFNKSTMPALYPKLPKQKNYTDCGLFLLEYAETFLSDPEFLLSNLHQNNPKSDLFTDEIINDKRDILKRLAIALCEGVHANRREGDKKQPNEEVVLGEKYREYRDKFIGTQILVRPGANIAKLPMQTHDKTEDGAEPM